VKEAEMKRATFFLLAVVVACAVPLLVAAQEQPAESEAQQQQGALSEAEKDFMADAAEGNLFEVKMGNLARERATSDAVRQFGEKMVNDHSKANEELQALARMKGVELPQEVSQEKQTEYDELADASKEDFDKIYMDMMVKDHEKDVEKFQTKQAEIADPDLKAWVTKTLPILQGHLSEAEKINGQLKSGPME
jgi:putative membrane protein